MYVLAYGARGQTDRGGKMSVKETIEIIAIQRGPSPVPTPPVSTTPGNVTSVSSPNPSSQVSLLWIPYVLIALVFIVFLGANFWCYHKKHRERYLRKRDEKRVKDGLHERRRITALMRSHFQSAFMSKDEVVEDFEDDDGDHVSVAASVSRRKSGSCVSHNSDSRLFPGQSWSPTESPSAGQPSPPVDRPSHVESWSAHHLFPGQSLFTPDGLPPNQMWSAEKLSPGQSSSSSGNPRQFWFADQPSPAPSVSMKLSPDQFLTLSDHLFPVQPGHPPGRLSPGRSFSLSDKLSHSRSISPDTPLGQTMYSVKLHHEQSAPLLDKRLPVQLSSPQEQTFPSHIPSDGEPDSTPSVSSAQALPPPDRPPPGQFLSADKLSSGPTISPDKLSPTQVLAPPDKLSPGQVRSAKVASSCQTLSPENVSPSQSCSLSAQSPGEPRGPWTNQNGSCRTNFSGDDVVCNVKRETSNGSVVH
ncbi:uncharacterized protein LOC143294232 [Babylonia areolata]|uniref:uncharacterized protein LOC143294232 n=1 Tax=Babylonia areolata TaxID=304850 RepID=UPI003FD3980F